MVLDPEDASNSAYVHPAYYNTSAHFVVDSSGAPSNGWMLTDGSGGESHGGGEGNHTDYGSDGTGMENEYWPEGVVKG